MADSALLSIVIPVFNKFTLTSDCLRSLREHAPDVRLEVIVVDNGSTDETATELDALGRSLFGEGFTAIHLPENKNFGPACNLGARTATGTHLFFLNNDTILTPGWFPPLLEGLRGDCAMTGPLLIYPESNGLFCERVQHLGVACKPQLYPFHLYEFFPASHPVARKPRAAQFLTGAAVLLRRELFFQAGMFHEGYINGGEDLDLCVQLRRLGYSMHCAPKSRIYHLQSQTPGRHDREKHNAELLKERCLSSLYPDMHLHLALDGYELALNDHMEVFAKLPERRETLLKKAFFRNSDRPGVDASLTMMEREPLFAPAYEILAGHSSEIGDFRTLTDVRFLQTRFFPCRAAAFRLRDAAAKAGDEKMLQEGKCLTAFYEKVDRNKDLPAMAREMVEYGKHLNQPAITKIYSSWLEQIKHRLKTDAQIVSLKDRQGFGKDGGQRNLAGKRNNGA